MDKKGRIQEHSKIKLELYRLYVELYLAVLINSKLYNSVYVHDIFAGKGKSDGENGSALLAAIEISKIRPKHSTVKVGLKLNEKNADSFTKLKKVLEPFKDFTELFNLDANNYIANWTQAAGTHSLFFIDPHGYTQISSENLRRLFTTNNCDFLIFIPIFHIYRFLKPSEIADSDDDEGEYYDLFDDQEVGPPQKRKIDKDKYYEPIAKFLSGLGIEKSDAEKCRNVEEFADIIINALKAISGSDFVYAQMIKNKNNNSKYCLFYISHHIRGAEKFLEAKSHLQQKFKEPELQETFDFVTPPEKASILDYINFDSSYDNASLFETGIKAGFRSTEITQELKDLEKNHKVEITSLPGKERKGRGYYVSYKHVKEKIISIKFFKEPQNVPMHQKGLFD